MTYEDWNVDNDEGIEPTEFEAAFAQSGYFSDWDTDGDHFLTESETYTAIFKAIDENENDRVSYEEWAVLREFYQEDMHQEFGAFENWDANDDRYLNRSEFANGLKGNRLFGEWDLNDDYFLSRDEMELGIFNAWDMSNDEMIDESEFNRWQLGYTNDS